MRTICNTFYTDYFYERNIREYCDNWVDGEEATPEAFDFENWFLETVEEELKGFVEVNLNGCGYVNEKIWDVLTQYGVTKAYRYYKETKGEITDETSDTDIITCLLMIDVMEHYQEWMEEMETDMKETDESTDDSDESDEATWFNTKYPNASCHRCEEKLNGHTVVMCGGRGGACETWYCASCHEDGTDDCGCESEEEDAE